MSIAKAIVRQNQKLGEMKGEESGLDHKKLLERLQWIREKTHLKLNLPLALVENVVNAVPPDKWHEEGDWFDIEKKKLVRASGKPYRTIDVATYLDESYDNIIDVVQEVAKGYSIDLPMWGMGSGQAGPPDISE